jgi:hypothetical protein
MNINALPLFPVQLIMSTSKNEQVKKNRVIQADIIKLNDEKTWISPKTPLVQNIKLVFLYMSQVSFILRPSYMDTHLSMCSAL